jgi:hypothetical protein
VQDCPKHAIKSHIPTIVFMSHPMQLVARLGSRLSLRANSEALTQRLECFPEFAFFGRWQFVVITEPQQTLIDRSNGDFLAPCARQASQHESFDSGSCRQWDWHQGAGGVTTAIGALTSGAGAGWL